VANQNPIEPFPPILSLCYYDFCYGEKTVMPWVFALLIILAFLMFLVKLHALANANYTTALY
jgi:hypothetical protein